MADTTASMHEDGVTPDGMKPDGAVTIPEAAAPRVRRHRIRRFFVGVLVFLTALLLLVTTLGVWVHRTVYRTSEFTSVVVSVGNDPKVLDPLATYLSVEAVQALDLRTRVQNALGAIADALPNRFGLADRIGALAAPITTGAQTFVSNEVRKFLHSSQFRERFRQLVETVHGKLVALLKGDYSQLPNISVQGPTVYFNTIPIVADIIRNVAQNAASLVGANVTIPQFTAGGSAATQLGQLGSALGVTLPPHFGQIPLMSSQSLHQAQTITRKFTNLLWLLLGLAIAFAVLAVVLSTNRRRTLVQLGLTVTATFIIGALVIRAVVHAAQDQITNAGAKAAAQDVLGVMAHNLRQIAALVLWPAVALAVIAYLAGKPPWFMRLIAWVRRTSVSDREGGSLARYVDQHFDWMVGGACGVALIVLVIVGLTWVSIGVVGGLLAVTILWLSAVRAGERARAGPDVAAT